MAAPSNMDGPPTPRPKMVSFHRATSPMSIINDRSPVTRPRVAIEAAPLLKTRSPPEDWDEEDEEESKSTLYLFLLTLSGLGLQIAWSVETSNGSPYLLSLGISKSLLALVWIAGPLSGVLVQPYVGLKSDNCRIRWGKRRPFIIGGAIATIMSLMVLAWAKEITSGFLGIFGANPDSQFVKTSVILFAVLFVYVLDFAINVIQAGIRAIVVDVAPTHQQEAANAWMIRSSGLGNILGYLAGMVRLPQYFPFLGDSQFKVLCAIASFILALTVAISCAAVRERDPRWDGTPETQDGVIAFFKSLGRSIRKLPLQIRRVCEVQFFAWIGWFPFLFYISTYVGQIYANPFFEENPNLPPERIDEIWEEATRVGTQALLIFAFTTFAASVFLPFIIPPTYDAPRDNPATPGAVTPKTPMTPTTPHSVTGGSYFSFVPTPASAAKKPKPQTFLERLSAYADMLQIQSLTLRRAWMLSHLLFAVLMWLTFLVRNTFTATLLVALIGIPWALTNWAPFALLSSEISKRDAMRRGFLPPAPNDDVEEDEGDDQAGVILGIHNVAIAAPQVIATLVSSGIFNVLQKPRGKPNDDSVEWVLRFGGICAVVAAYMTLRVKEERKEDVLGELAIPRERPRRTSSNSFSDE